MAKPPSGVELCAHLEKLPQEVYDTIYNMTFTTPPNVTIITAQSVNPYKPPPDLQFNLMGVDRESRQQYLTSFYDNTAFHLPYTRFCRGWVHKMPLHHQRLVRVVRCIVPHYLASSPHLAANFARNEHTRTKKSFAKMGWVDFEFVIEAKTDSEVEEDE